VDHGFLGGLICFSASVDDHDPARVLSDAPDKFILGFAGFRGEGFATNHGPHNGSVCSAWVHKFNPA
jgi:hypothetical protein